MIVWRKILQQVPVILGLAILSAAPLRSQTQEGSLDKAAPKDITAQEVIQRFTAKEKQWKQIRQQYSFQQSVKVQTMSGKEVVGEYRQVAEISYATGAPV